MKIYKILILLFLFSNIQNSYSQFSPVELYTKGLQKFYEGNFDEAVKYFNDYIAVATNDIKGFNYRGLSNLALKNYPRAIEDFTSIITINNTNVEGYTNRGYAYLFQGNNSSAITDFSNAIQYGPADIEGYIGRCGANIALRKMPNALKDLTLGAGIDPKNPRIYINKAWISYLTRDTLGFVSNVNQALYYDSNIVFTSSERDLIFIKVEMYKNALAYINHNTESNNSSYFDYFARGFIYFLLNKYNDSKADINTSVKIYKNKNNPDFNNAVNSLLRSIARNG